MLKSPSVSSACSSFCSTRTEGPWGSRDSSQRARSRVRMCCCLKIELGKFLQHGPVGVLRHIKPCPLPFHINLVKARTIGKVFLAGLAPSPKGLIDCHQVECGKLLGVLGLGLGRDGAVKVLACNVLAFVAVEVFQ